MSKTAFNQNILYSHSGCIQESFPAEKEMKEKTELNKYYQNGL